MMLCVMRFCYFPLFVRVVSHPLYRPRQQLFLSLHTNLKDIVQTNCECHYIRRPLFSLNAFMFNFRAVPGKKVLGWGWKET